MLGLDFILGQCWTVSLDYLTVGSPDKQQTNLTDIQDENS